MNHIIKNGHINDKNNTLIKHALLKYISEHKLSQNERNILTKLINFAFPLGIPKYQPDIELPERSRIVRLK